jgi:hypothetical protein
MRLCSVEGCGKKHSGNGYCTKHRMQINLYGKILERTINDPNEFIIDGDICWILLYNKKCIEIARAKIDIKYYEQIKNSVPKLKWCLNNRGYVTTTWFDKEHIQHQISLHQAIIQLSGKIIQLGEEIDHKDGDKLNCLDENLRICKHLENTRNRGKNKNNTSGYKGVIWHKPSKKWEAYISDNNGNREHLGLFSTIETAAKAYNTAAVKYHGEFAVLNII